MSQPKDLIQQQQIQYPFYPPNDNELRYDPEFVQIRSDPISFDKQSKFCPSCDYPIAVRVCLFPCGHYMCYECYLIKGSTYCKMFQQNTITFNRCNEAISQYIRLSDNERFYSCDQETCNKYFKDELDYQNHMKLHDDINSINKK